MKESLPNTKKETSPREQEPHIEIERKYLLASPEDLEKLEEKILSLFSDAKIVGEYDERSYYFSPIKKEEALKFLNTLTFNWMYDVDRLENQLDGIPDNTPIQLRSRTRFDEDRQSFSSTFTFKASEDPLHDEERIEIDAIGENYGNPRNKRGLSELGIKLTSAWHSKRKVYQIDSKTKIDLQHVTGYGYTAEIESSSAEKIEAIENQLGLISANPEALGVMYKKYSENWQEYYEGEERSFNEEEWEEVEAEIGEQVVRNKLE
ncbi:MAG: hypothetical protein R3346_04595 [Candidatus Spechtbacterales bacterium]|nr:hypothetical protein [Candidatus Spechtbacterales bacterium]